MKVVFPVKDANKDIDVQQVGRQMVSSLSLLTSSRVILGSPGRRGKI
jgi:hypothetical protein